MKKSNFIVRILAILTIFSIMATGCQSKLERYSAEFMILFNTVTRFVSYAPSKEDFQRDSQFIYDRLEYYHQLYNIYDDFDGINNIKTINDKAGVEPVKVNEDIIQLLKFSKDRYEETHGKVNIAMGAVLKIWKTYRDEGEFDEEIAKLPSMAELQNAAQHIDIDKMIIDEAAGTVYLSDPEMSLDVGAIAKGYATQRVVEESKAKGLTNGILSVGGNVCTIGTKPGKELWSVGIQNPDKSQDASVTDSLLLEDMTLVSSGDYERYYVVDGKRYHHIINPDTLMPADYFRQVSVIAKDSGLADAYSTAVFNMTLEEGKAFIESHDEVEAMWLLQDDSQVFTDGFHKYQKNQN